MTFIPLMMKRTTNVCEIGTESCMFCDGNRDDIYCDKVVDYVIISQLLKLAKTKEAGDIEEQVEQIGQEACLRPQDLLPSLLCADGWSV